jgi:ketosteroid isomerase-like protein
MSAGRSVSPAGREQAGRARPRLTTPGFEGTVMHPNRDIVARLFTALDRHDHAAMADCYAESASFSDIAFHLTGRPRIHAMWHMICEGDIRARFEIVDVDDRRGVVDVVDDYTFRPTSRRVNNRIRSYFEFENGRIVAHRDTCDARRWAAMALGGLGGFLAGVLPFVRRRKAAARLDAFVAQHPEYGGSVHLP